MTMNAETIVERTQITAVSIADAPVVTPPETLLQEWADKITDASGQAVEKILAMGRLLLEAKKAIKHGEWERLFKGHPQAIANPVRFSVEMARMLMKIAAHPVLSNGNYSSLLPLSWRTLHELTFIPEADLLDLLATGSLTPETTQAEVLAMRHHQPAPLTQGHLPVLDEQIHAQETVDITLLKPHPRNYREHPEDQLVHIIQSLKEHGFYRNIVVARDYTILAGHGMVQAARRLGCETVPVIVLDLDPDEPRAIKILIGDNDIGQLAEVDDQQRNDILTTLNNCGELEGTGYDALQRSALLMVTRRADVLMTADEKAEWEALGMPACEAGAPGARLMIQFRDEQDREQYVAEHAVAVTKKGVNVWSAWWPPQEPDGQCVKWVGAAS